jgi:hypothetical protein
LSAGGDAAGALPAFLDVPFPSDAYRQNGALVAPPGLDAVFTQGAQYIAHELPKTDGFSRVAPALFAVDDLAAGPDANGAPTPAVVDSATLPDGEKACTSDASAVYLVDVAAMARVPCRTQVHDMPNERVPRPLLAVGPARGVVLDEGHAYVAVVTSRAKDKSGNAVAPSADFAAVVAGTRSSALQQLYGTAYDAAAKVLGPALAKDGATIVGVAPYTTNTMTRELFAMREALESAPDPALAWDAATVAPMTPARFAPAPLPAGFTATLDDWLGVTTKKLPDGTDDPDETLPARAHDKIGAVGTAVFAAENFLQSLPGGYPTLDHATFVHDAMGNVVPPQGNATAKIWITFALPSAPPPAGGYPVVIIQHGLSASRVYMLDLANTFAAQGWASAAIDSVTFGARAPEGQYQQDVANDFGGTYAGPDGFGDKDGSGNTNGSNDLFGNLENLGAFRDQWRQGEFDTSQVVKLLRSSALDLSPLKTSAGAATPKLDPSRIAYFSDSLGSLEGAVTAAFEPNVKLWVFNVGGAGLGTELAPHAPAINVLARIAAGANFGQLEVQQNESSVFLNLLQQIIEPCDGIAYAPFLVKNPRMVAGAPVPPRNILQFEVLYDEVVANEANEALARAGGWGIATPNVGSNADIRDIKNIANNPGRTPLSDVAPDSTGAIHDTPVQGVTAVVVQASPAAHGKDAVASTAQRQFCIPWAVWTDPDPFHHLDLDKYFRVRDPYVALQATAVRFVRDGFAGNVPNVTVMAPPVRDFDDDGVPDDMDADPCAP